jgi:hypothetical protein
MFTCDMYSCGAPKRGDIVQTNVGSKRERTWLVLGVRRAKREPKGVPRYKIWAARWWELEAEMRMALYRSAERNGGQGIIYFRRYPAKKKKSFEQHMRRKI